MYCPKHIFQFVKKVTLTKTVILTECFHFQQDFLHGMIPEASLSPPQIFSLWEMWLRRYEANHTEK